MRPGSHRDSRPGRRGKWRAVAAVTAGLLLVPLASASASPTCGSLVMPSRAEVGQDVAITAMFKEAGRPRTVELQRWTSNMWAVVDSLPQDDRGDAQFTVRHEMPGTFRYRAVAVAPNGAAPWTTLSRQIVVKPAEPPPPDTTAPGPVTGCRPRMSPRRVWCCRGRTRVMGTSRGC